LKLVLLAAVIGGLVVAARKLMGGLGPQPGAADAPKEWPSLVPQPPAPEASGNGSGNPDPSQAAAEAPTTTDRIAPTEDFGSNS